MEIEEVLPPVVLIVVIKLVIDIDWGFHMLVNLQNENYQNYFGSTTFILF